MRAPPLSRVIRFLLIAAGLIILLSIIWTFIEPYYSDFLTGIARGIVSPDVKVTQAGGRINFDHTIPYMGGRLHVNDSINAAAIQFGLILTIALVAATPGLSPRRRALFTGIAVAATFVLQVLSVVLMAKTFNSLLFVIVSDVVPPLLWAFLALRYWLRGEPQAAPAESSTGGPVEKDEAKTRHEPQRSKPH